jgi:hypothetical protein
MGDQPVTRPLPTQNASSGAAGIEEEEGEARSKLSSLPRTLGSWVRIPTQGMDICLCVYSLFVLSCVGSGLSMG